MHDNSAMGLLKDSCDKENLTPYMCTMIDGFSRYAVTIAMPDHKSETVARTVLNHWISPFGAPVVGLNSLPRHLIECVMK